MAEPQRKTEAKGCGPARSRRYEGLVRGACGCGVLRAARGFGEIISFTQAVVNAAGDFRGMRTANGAAASPNPNHEDVFRMRLAGVRDEPAEATTERFVVACAGLAEGLLAIGVVALLRGAVHHGSEHAFAQIGKQRRDIKLLAHTRLKILARFGGARILQVILRAAVR